jgi:outer membrane receptor protein involved in Fe transport
MSLLAVAGFVANTMSPVASAQSAVTGGVSGTVSDATGAVVPGATVVVIDTSTDAKQTVKTNAEGRYTVGLLKPGTYKITATAESLKSETLQVTVVLGTTVPGDIQVTPTSNATVIEVTSTSLPLVDTQNVALATTFTEEQIQELPTPGGDVTTVAFTAPGVVVNAGGSYGNFSSDGLPGISNLFVLNGFDNQDPFLNLNNSGSSNLTLGQGELAEATVVQNGYNSQYGRAAGAVINYTTKSGTNKFHGEALYNYNGTLLNANGWFNNYTGSPRPHAVSNEWAANAGGPIIKDKLFFFSDYEGLRYILPASGFFTAPTPQLEAYTQATITSEALPASALAFANQGFGLYDAASTKYGATPQTGTCGFLTGVQASPGNYFDALPKGVAVGGIVPCMQQAFGAANNFNKEWLYTQRFDWNISDKHKIYGRFKVDQGSQPTYTSFINPLFDAVSIQPEYEGQFNDSYVISPTKTNVFVAAANWYSAYFGPASNADALAVYPFFGVLDAGLDGSGTAESGGLSLLGVPGALTQGRNVTQYQFEDDFSWIHGKNTMKLGFNFRRDLVEDYDQRIGTVFPQLTILDLQDFTLGELGPNNDFYPYNSFSQTFTNAQTAHMALYNVGTYFQDEFQALPNLKLTLGVRVDRTGNPLCHSGCFSEYAAGTFAAQSLTDPYYSKAGGPINPNNWHPFPSVQIANVQPRFGFNYSFNQKTEVRAGAGIFSDLYPASFLDGVIQNFPNVFTPPITAGVVAPSGAGNVVSNAVEANSVVQTGFGLGEGWGQINNTLINLPSPVSTSPPGIGAYFPGKFKVPEYAEYSVQIQRQLSPSDAIIITYAGNYGYDEVIVNGFVNPSSGFFNPTDGMWEGTGAPLIGGIGNVPTNQNFSKITAFTNNAHSNYNGLQINYKRNGHGVTGQLSYTYSHSLDIISNAGVGLPWNGGAVTGQITPTVGRGGLNYSNSDYDVRNNVTGDVVYEDQFKASNAVENYALGGWVASAKTYWRTGEPYSLESSQSGDYGQLGGVLMGQSLVATSNLTNLAPSNPHSCVTNANCLDSTQYVAPGNQTTFGNLRRNAFYGPHYVDTDLSLAKDFYKRESLSFRVGANAYNVFNHANFSPPGSVLGTSSFGAITSVQAPPTSPYGSFQGAAVTQRVLQVFGKFVF